MDIRRAEIKDIPAIDNLLYQVAAVHNKIRPDLFKVGCKKYTDEELHGIILNDETPIFVAETEQGVLGYAFCVFKRVKNDNNLRDLDTLYIDDLCVDEGARGQHVGRALFEYVKGFAKESGCHNLTLNVWSGNTGAEIFYSHQGLKPQKTTLEMIL